MTGINHKLRQQHRIRHGVFVILLLVLMVVLGYLATQYRMQWDISQNQRNSLNEASIDILQKLPGPVQVTAYATEYQAEIGDIRKVIADFVSLYQRIKPDLVLQFIDPVEQPLLAQQANVQINGEIVISYRHKTEHLAVINEQTFSNALMRLARLEDKLIIELSGHGERKLDGHANFDLGEFGKSLQRSGFSNQSLNLAIERDIPLNADLLIIASPQVDLLPGEVDKLLEYIDRGGNLLWLVDQESLRGLLPLTEKLRLTLTPGIVVDPHAEQLKAPVTFSLGAVYGQHPITSGFQYITVFPYARQITIDDNADWNSVSLVEVAPDGWVETGDLNAGIAFDEAADVPGPISVVAALSRNINDREQRVVIVGSGHFLANTYLGNGNNLDFGINLVNWLTGDEEMMVIQPRATIDNNLMLNQSQLTLMAVGQMVVLPLLFLATGISIWWYRRRKATP
ncbi:MAG: GldG family protein [Nitrosomonas sp.]|uniref:GldG family protein n=1 Tax=Nitrosomonas sp. TaxID=42353 RepID=UPI001D684457|nr:GldG family protein [Nitrosomonas sp.]MBX9894584.1 GldG family protein [Nitrosomonas sp.]